MSFVLFKFKPQKAITRNIKVRLPSGGESEVELSPDIEYVAYRTPEGIFLRPSDPPLSKIYLEPTTKCNLNCRTCMRHSWDEPEGVMDMTTYRRLIKSLRKVPSLRTIAFWGFGEPMMHPEIVKMIRMAHRLGVKTELISNALLLDIEKAKGLIKAGLDSLVVSVDGTSPESHAGVRTGADLNKVIENVQNLHAMRIMLGSMTPEVGIEFVLMKRNLHELPELTGIARSMQASYIYLTNVFPYTKEYKDEILFWLSAGNAWGPSKRAEWIPKIELPRIDNRKEYIKPLLELVLQGEPAELHRTIPDIGIDGHCPFVWEGAAAVSWDGSVSPCVGLMHSYSCYILDREKKIRRYVVGNINEKDIRNIWNRKEYREFRKRVLEFDFPPCLHCECDLCEFNEEDCYGNPFPVCGDCLWARGIILCP